MSSFQTLGKYLDQPMLVAKFQKSVPSLLIGSTATYTLFNTAQSEKKQRKTTAVKTGITLGTASLSALIAPNIASKITKRALQPSLKSVQKKQNEIIDDFIKTNTIDKETKSILNKNKGKIFSVKDIKTLFEKISNNKKGNEFLNKLVPPPKDTTAKDIFGEISYLSVLGAVPVAGGIIGGFVADRLVDKDNISKKIPDKIKEGSYQYLANIFLCNIGAGIALAMLEKAGIKSKSARAIGMILGIITTGIIGGSMIANYIGRKIIDPICKKLNCGQNDKHQNKDRTPEILDIGLHTDDIATVSLLSGLKWIEPALPLMYTISGYRAGIGYRN